MEYDIVTKSGKKYKNFFQISEGTYVGLRLGDHALALHDCQIHKKEPSKEKIYIGLPHFEDSETGYKVHPSLANFKKGGYDIPEDFLENPEIAEFVRKERISKNALYNMIFTEPERLLEKCPSAESLVLQLPIILKIVHVLRTCKV